MKVAGKMILVAAAAVAMRDGAVATSPEAPADNLGWLVNTMNSVAPGVEGRKDTTTVKTKAVHTVVHAPKPANGADKLEASVQAARAEQESADAAQAAVESKLRPKESRAVKQHMKIQSVEEEEQQHLKAVAAVAHAKAVVKAQDAVRAHDEAVRKVTSGGRIWRLSPKEAVAEAHVNKQEQVAKSREEVCRPYCLLGVNPKDSFLYVNQPIVKTGTATFGKLDRWTSGTNTDCQEECSKFRHKDGSELHFGKDGLLHRAGNAQVDGMKTSSKDLVNDGNKLQRSQCVPICTWKCDKPVCEKTCKPLCKTAPKCFTHCPTAIDGNKCEKKCNVAPKCRVECVPEATPCPKETGGCKPCKTVCEDTPDCEVKCPSVKCESVCDQPMCEWECDKPKDCPKPKCDMVCEEDPHCSLGGSAAPSPKKGFSVAGKSEAEIPEELRAAAAPAPAPAAMVAKRRVQLRK